MLVDPSVSFHLGQGFTSTAWYGQARHEFFAGCPILYQLLLIGWMEWFGLSLTAIRSLGYVLTLIGVWLIWLAVRRSHFIARDWMRLGLFVMLLTGYGMTFAYRCGRAESLLVMLTGATFFVLTLQSHIRRWMLLFILGGATAWTAYHAPVFAGSSLGVALLLRRDGFWRDVLAFGCGGGAGSGGLYFYIHTQDPDGRIVKAINEMFISGQRYGPLGYADPSLALMFFLLLGLVWHGWQHRIFKWQSASGYSLVSVLAVPLLVCAAGRYPIYYSWMAWLLIIPGVFHALNTSWISLGINSRFGALMLLFIAGFIGLPARLGLTLIQWAERDHTPIAQLAAAHMKPSDWVFTDYAGYYAVKPIVEVAATQWFIPAMSDEDKRRLNWLFVSPSNLAMWTEALGGDWEDSGVGNRTSSSRVIDNPSSKYDLRLYRKRAGEPHTIRSNGLKP